MKQLLLSLVFSLVFFTSYSQDCSLSKLTKQNQLEIDSFFVQLNLVERTFRYTISTCEKPSLMTKLYYGDFEVRYDKFKNKPTERYLENDKVEQYFIYFYDYYNSKYFLIAKVDLYEKL